MRVRKFTAYTPLVESRGGRVSRSVDEGKAGRVFKKITLIKRGLGNKKDKNFYTESALRDGVKRGLFEGLRAFVDHPSSIDEEIQPERTVRDFCGLYENAYYDDRRHQVRADFRVVGPHNRWLADTIDELIAAGHGDKIGLSINGRGETEPTHMHLAEAGGDVEVNALKQFIELRSTDVVTEAGAGGGFSALLESARRAKESGTMKRTELEKQLREAVRKGDMPKAQKVQRQLDALPADDTKGKKTAEAGEDDEDDKVKGKKTATKEMGSFDPKKKPKKPMYEAREDEDEDAVDDEDDDVDHDAELDEATERAATGDDEDDDGDDEDDLDEAADDEDDDLDDEDDEDDDVESTRETSRGRDEDDADTPAHLRAARRHREHMAQSRTREAIGERSRGPKITGATGGPTGKIKTAPGRFNKPAKMSKRGSSIPEPPKKLPWGRGKKKRMSEAAASDRAAARELATLRETNRRLREDITRRMTADRAKKLLRESDIPPAVRPHLIHDMVGMSEKEMRRFIDKEERKLQSVVESVRGGMDDYGGFDSVEGNPGGSTMLRESFASRGGDDIADIFADVGLPMKP